MVPQSETTSCTPKDKNGYTGYKVSRQFLVDNNEQLTLNNLTLLVTTLAYIGIVCLLKIVRVRLKFILYIVNCQIIIRFFSHRCLCFINLYRHYRVLYNNNFLLILI
jgi:hypothetical protein